MDRREFLHRSAVIVSGLSLTPLSSWSASPRTTATDLPLVSLGVVTDRPDAAIRSIQKTLARVLGSCPDAPALRVREFRIPGRHVADVVLTRPSGVVDVWRARGALPHAIRQCTSALHLRRVVEDPTYLEFSVGSVSRGRRRLTITRDQDLIATPEMDRAPRELTVETSLGTVVVHVGGGHARIVSAPCRHQTCVGMGIIDRPGQRVVCVPCRLSLSVFGGGAESIDAVVG